MRHKSVHKREDKSPVNTHDHNSNHEEIRLDGEKMQTQIKPKDLGSGARRQRDKKSCACKNEKTQKRKS